MINVIICRNILYYAHKLFFPPIDYSPRPLAPSFFQATFPPPPPPFSLSLSLSLSPSLSLSVLSLSLPPSLPPSLSLNKIYIPDKTNLDSR